MQNYNFKVIAKLKDDLTPEQYKTITDKINWLMGGLRLMKLDDITYCCKIQDNREFSAVCIFFHKLSDVKYFFSKLEYYDFEENEQEIAV